jgi:hypothetical protein
MESQETVPYLNSPDFSKAEGSNFGQYGRFPDWNLQHSYIPIDTRRVTNEANFLVAINTEQLERNKLNICLNPPRAMEITTAKLI